MVTMRIAEVRHFVEDQTTLSVGDTVTVGFHPSPGECYVSISLKSAPELPAARRGSGVVFTPGGLPANVGAVAARSGAGGAAGLPRRAIGRRLAAEDAGRAAAAAADEPRPNVVFLRRPPFPRPIHPRLGIGGGIVVEDPDPIQPPPPPAPLPVRVEVGPEGGPVARVFDRPRPGTIKFIVGDEPGQPTNTDGEGRVIDRSGELLDRFPRAPTRPPRWICRITNLDDHRVACYTRVVLPVRRAVRVTELPRDRFTKIFEGGLRWLTPTISVVNGEAHVALPDEAAEVLDVDAKTIDLDDLDLSGFDVSSATIEMEPVTFEVLTAEQMMRTAYEDLVARIEFLARGTRPAGPRPAGSSSQPSGDPRYQRLVASMPSDFVDTMLQFSFGGERGIASLAAFHLTRGNPTSTDYDAVRAAFVDIGVPTELNAFADDPVLLATLTIGKVVAEGTAVVGTHEVFLDAINARVFVLIGTRNKYAPHPLSGMPDHPRADQYANEFTVETSIALTTRVAVSIGDFDIDSAGIIGPPARVIGDIFGKVPSKREIEDRFEAAIRGLLDDNKGILDRGALDVMLTIADRDHVLHDVRCDANELVIEHFDPIGDVPFQLPRISRRLRRPIDGPMPADADDRLARVDHIVVVTMENRSFDQMLGFLSHPSAAVQPAGPRQDVDGLRGNEQVPLGPNVAGNPVTPTATTEEEFLPDPRHDFYSVALQIGAGGEMEGFIPSFRDLLLDSHDIRLNGPLDDETRIIRFQPASRVPTYAYLAHEFGVLDRYFCSFPGGTQPNRVCMLTGRTPALTNAEMTADIGYLEDQTLFALLDRARVFWRYYEGDIGFIRAFKSYRTDFSRVRELSEFLGRSRDDPMPSVTFIDPNFKEAPSELPAADDHAPTPVCRGQILIRDIVARLMDSRTWSRTLLVITYDEHGGFYDHVAPPGTAAFAAANPTVGEIPRVHPDATRFGVRVPTLLVSPLIDVETVGHRIYDHTSVTRTILERFVPDLVGFMPERVRRARHFGELLRDAPRSSVPEQPEFPTGFECDGSPIRFSTPQSGVAYELSRRPPDDERFQMQLLGVPMRPLG